MVHGSMDAQYGSFAEYVKTDGALVVKVPDHVEATRASSVGIAGYTAAQVGLNSDEMKSTSLTRFTTHRLSSSA
jgi:NADPH:quinone reductase-like Zn-dependent oxidoreductase